MVVQVKKNQPVVPSRSIGHNLGTGLTPRKRRLWSSTKREGMVAGKNAMCLTTSKITARVSREMADTADHCR